MPGSMGTGSGAAEGMSGGMECGRDRRMRVPTGAILTTITTIGAGRTTKVTGIMKTMATTMTGDIAKPHLFHRGPTERLGLCCI